MSNVTVVGAGLLGRGIACVVARAGFNVTLHDANPDVLASVVQHVNSVVPAQPGRQVIAQLDLKSAAASADLLIEAVIEDLAIKQRVFEIAGAANPGAVLMSNSSVLPIGQISARTLNPQRTVGTHWWNPPGLIPIVEVIRGPHTDESVLRRAWDFLHALGKTPVRVEKDVPGFVGNRLQHALWREALSLLSAGVASAQTIDHVVRVTLGRSLAERGPIAEMNALGLDLVANEFRHLLASIDSQPQPAALLREKVRRGELGAKSGRGFLEWPEGRRAEVAANLQAHVERRLNGSPFKPSAEPLLTAEELAIARRLRLAVWREALSLVTNGLCDAATVDLVATLTIGLRLAVMAPIENADYVGLDLTLAIHEAVLPSLDSSLQVPAILLHSQVLR